MLSKSQSAKRQNPKPRDAGPSRLVQPTLSPLALVVWNSSPC